MKKSSLTLQQVKETIAQDKSYFEQKYHIREIGVFGSFVRGEQKLRSDVDILVDFSQTISAFDFIEMKLELTSKLGRKVDLVSKMALKPRIGKRILEEVVYV